MEHTVLAGLFWILALLWYALVVSLLTRVAALLVACQGFRQGAAGVSGVGLIGLGAALAIRD